MRRLKLDITAIVISGLIIPGVLTAQVDTLNLIDAYAMLEENYPVLRNAELLRSMHAAEVDNIDKGRLPSIYAKADSRFQNENLSIEGDPTAPTPFEFALPLFTAKGYLEIQYDLLNGKTNNVRQNLSAVDLQTELQNIEVDRYALKDQLNDLFIGVITLREQLGLLDYSLDDLEVRRSTIESAVEHGVALGSELAQIRVRQLELEANRADLEMHIAGSIRTIESLTGADLDEDVVLFVPDLGSPGEIPGIARPEIELLNLQREEVLAQSDMIDLSRRPQLNLFAQGGVGYPNPVNAFDTDAAPFGIVGINFAWKITDWKQTQTDKQLLALKAQQITHARETLEFNLRTQEQNYLVQVERIRKQIETDEEIAILQGEILGVFGAQLDEGVITSADYISQLNTELRARQNLAIHRAELLRIQLDFWNARGAL